MSTVNFIDSKGKAYLSLTAIYNNSEGRHT